MQVANDVNISEVRTKTGGSTGVQTFLHAAATVLRRKQDERLRKSPFFSDMGDGSTDRNTIEQEVMYLRYPTFSGDPKHSLSGLRFSVEYLDLLQVDVSYSADKKSFDARAVLISTYHTAYLERGLASLPAELPVRTEPVDLLAARARRSVEAGASTSNPPSSSRP